MIDLSLINQIFVVLIIAVGLSLGTWVYFTNRKNKTNQLFLLMTFFLSLWIVFCYFGNISTRPATGLLLAKLAYGVVALFFIPFYFFFSFFLEEENKFLTLNKLVLGVCIFLFLFTLYTNLMVTDMEFTRWGAIPVLGVGKFFYLSIILFLALFIISRLFLNHFKSSTEKRLKLQYFLTGLFIFIIANLVFNVVLPFWQKIPQYYYIGNYSAVFFLGFTAYAIIKKELFGIRIVLTALLVGIIAILVLLDIVIFTDTIEMKLFKSLLLVLFLYFGHLLIQSVLREMKYREELEKAYQELQRLDKAKSEFISIASHQLRTPLTSIKGYISMILEGTYGKLSQKSQRPMKNVYQSNERLIKLVNDILDVTRIETGRIELNLKKSSLEDIISSIVEELKNEAKKKNIYLRQEKPKTSLPLILIDEEKIRQAILNIIDNAIKYTNKGGVVISTQVKNSIVKMAVQDTGSGMTKEELSKLFESFSRGTAGKRLYTEGVGLGLYIAKKFI